MYVKFSYLLLIKENNSYIMESENTNFLVYGNVLRETFQRDIREDVGTTIGHKRFFRISIDVLFSYSFPFPP